MNTINQTDKQTLNHKRDPSKNCQNAIAQQCIAQNITSQDMTSQSTNQQGTAPQSHALTPQARLIFALDATGSRQASWEKAQQIQREMFRATETCGGLLVQLCYYRDHNQFTATPWVHEANSLDSIMSSVECLGGYTQIEKLMRHALHEHHHTPVKAIVFVGDSVEEDVDVLCQLAKVLHQNHLPLYAFQEGNDPFASAALQQLAHLSGGMHLQFNSYSPDALAQLLGAIAAWAAGGEQALSTYVNINNTSTNTNSPIPHPRPKKAQHSSLKALYTALKHHPFRNLPSQPKS